MRFVKGVLVLAFWAVLFIGASLPQSIDRAEASSASALVDYRSAPLLNESTLHGIDSFFDAVYRSGIFNGTYLFFRNDSLITGARGYSNFGARQLAEPDDLFQLASISKTFTGVSMMKMQQDGLLNIDDSVHWHLPDFKRRNLTLRQLLSHSSGLPDYFNLALPSGVSPSGHMRNEDVLRLLNAQSYRMFARPGHYDYCNSNYALLALIIERKTGMDFRDYAREAIFKPAGMRFTHICNFDSFPLVRYPVQGYKAGQVYGDLPHNGTTGDKGVYSNVYEMLLYDRALRSDFILHADAKKAMYTPQVATSSEAHYGLGWRMRVINGHKWVFHNGWWKGFRTYFWRSLEENKMFCVLTNNVRGSFLPTVEMVHLLD
jgi:CubicO group peptidase (beta-lactamase class C family)